MGIPSFYRWLVERYPRAVVNVIEDELPIPDTTRPNPNGIEFDNLYLDMNGIVHPCFHPEGLPAPKNYDEVFLAVFSYIDRIFSIVRPRKLLYLAIDGVAPRAKMNQQRSRRFRAAKEAADEVSGRERELASEEEKSASFEQSKKLDSNVITPGTEFMALLSSALRYYVRLRMNMNSGWRGIKVILSDANVPGEGEHKIMSYIRLQRNLVGYDPNTRHCLYGLDADLIMLALATHELHFSILREDVRGAGPSEKAFKHPNEYVLRNRVVERGNSEQMKVVYNHIEDYISRQKFQILNIWVLREYLAIDMKIQGLKKKADLERLIDDFVFMCLLVGNDFLPHIPSLEISEGAIDLLMTVYRKEFITMGGYLTNSFEINLKHVEHFIQVVGSYEGAIFRRRTQIVKERELRFQSFSSNTDIIVSSNFMSENQPNSNVAENQTATKCTSIGSNAVVDKIKLGEKGWKERFYAEKFQAETEDDRKSVQRHAVSKYIEGLCWVMRYYYEGVCSWQWFYPYHYAPFASDFHGIDLLKFHFTLGKPFKPFDQLLGVLPAASAHALPLFYRKLMTDISSPLLDFYPPDFELDMNGKRFPWQAICKLPFIEESRLLSEIAKVEHTLTDEERHRNSFSLDLLFVHVSYLLAVEIGSFCERKVGHPKLMKAKVKRKINPIFSGGMNGYVYISGQPVQPAEIYSPIEGMEMISDNEVLSVFFKCPPFHSHIPRLLKEVKLPSKSVRKQDIFPPPILWHEKSAVRGCLSYERSIHKSISGHRLAELAHRLLSKFYHPKSQKVHGSMELDEADGLTSHANLKATVHVGGTRDNENFVHGGISANHIGTDKLASRVQMACAGMTEGEKNFFNSQVIKRTWSQCNGLAGKHVGDQGLACFSKSAETVSASGAGAEIVSINVTSRKRRRKQRKFRETGENIDPEKFACPLKLGTAVFKMGTEADKISLDNEVRDKHSGETGPNGYACPGVVPIKISVDGKSRKRKRKQKQTKVIVVFDDHAGEKGLACPSNSLPTAGEVGVQADENCSDSGVPDNTICETGLNGLACHQVPDKSCFDGKSRKRKRKRKRKQSKVIVVLDDLVCATGLKCHSNLMPVACKVCAGDEKNTVDDGVPDHDVGETGANGLACANGVPDENYVHGKSTIPEQSEVRGALNNHVVAEEFQCTTNLDPTADKNCVDGRIPDNSGKTETNGLVCGDGKSRKKRRKKGNATFVVNDHLGAEDLTRPMDLGPKVGEVRTEADKSCTDNGAPDNHAGETKQNVLGSGPKYP